MGRSPPGASLASSCVNLTGNGREHGRGQGRTGGNESPFPSLGSVEAPWRVQKTGELCMHLQQGETRSFIESMSESKASLPSPWRVRDPSKAVREPSKKV